MFCLHDSSVSKRIGVTKEIIGFPIDMGQYNDEIAELFDECTNFAVYTKTGTCQNNLTGTCIIF